MNDEVENVLNVFGIHAYTSISPSLFIFHLESRFLREKNIREVPRCRFQRYIGRNLAYII